MSTDRSAFIQPINALEAAVRQRNDTDVKFMNWWIYFLLLSWITFGIAAIYYFIKRISRVDKYSVRKREYYEAVIEFTDRYATTRERQAQVGPLVGDMRNALERAASHDLRPIGALKSVLLTIITFGIWGIVAWYQLNRAWSDRQNVERTFNEQLSRAWIELGLTSYPIVFQPASGKDRNFWLWLILSIITFGIWALVWDYKVHTDPDNIYPRVHQVEDTVVQLARAA